MDKTRLLPGVPLVESPLFALETDALDWSDQERAIARQLHERGYAVITFPDADLDARAERIKAALGPRFGLPADGEAARGVVAALEDARVQDAWNDDADVHAIATNAAVQELLSKLYGRRAFPFQTLNFPVGTQQHLHCDTVHFSSLPERFMCGVWVALEDIHPNSGTLEYVAGSHRWAIPSNMMMGRRGADNFDEPSPQSAFEPMWRALVAASGTAPEAFVPRKGQALIWSANLLHGGGVRSERDHTRWSQVTHYYFDDCLYYTPAYSDEAVGRLHLRAMTDIGTGKRVPNLYLGEDFDPPKPAPKRRSATARLRTLVRRLA